jgi:hypothetical protein
MSQLPGAVILINNDVNDTVLATLGGQLLLDGYMTDTVFNSVIALNPNYMNTVHSDGYRILVILSDFRDLTNRNLADVVIFFAHGMANVMKNNLGPPTLSLPIARLNIYALLRANNSSQVVILPTTPSRRQSTLQGPLRQLLIDDFDPSGVHDANIDCELFNQDFINRK